VWPVIQRASSEARNATTAATSSGIGMPGIGLKFSNAARMAAGSGAVSANRCTSGVHTAVGAIALTRMFWPAYSIAALRVRPITPAFAKVYGEMLSCPVRPAVEAVFTMLPPPVVSICSMQYFMT
jgi:hypothetical protein